MFIINYLLSPVVLTFFVGPQWDSEYKNDFTCVVLICVEINCPGNWFKMAVLGCMSPVLVDN